MFLLTCAYSTQGKPGRQNVFYKRWSCQGMSFEQWQPFVPDLEGLRQGMSLIWDFA